MRSAGTGCAVMPTRRATIAPMRSPTAAWFALSGRSPDFEVSAALECALDAPREHGHLLLGLAVALELRDIDAAPIGIERLARASGLHERPRIQLPRGRELRIERDGARQRLRGGGPLPRLRVLAADRKAQQRAILARGQHSLETLQRRALERRLRRGWIGIGHRPRYRRMNSPLSQSTRRSG